MSDFLKTLLRQVGDIWAKLSTSQRIVMTSVLVLTLGGLIGLIVWAGMSGGGSTYATLFSNLDLAESSSIVEQLKEGKYEYKVES